jgi:glutamate-1-semialdehyde 2,1-aminomutase
VVSHLWSFGKRLMEDVNRISGTLGLGKYFAIEGIPPSPNYVTRDRDMKPSMGFRTLFSQEMVRNGVLMPWLALSLAHGDEELSWTLQAVEASLRVYSLALEGNLKDHLVGPVIKPVFRQYN